VAVTNTVKIETYYLAMVVDAVWLGELAAWRIDCRVDAVAFEETQLVSTADLIPSDNLSPLALMPWATV